MEFGRLTLQELPGVDFRLPPEPVRNARVLPGKPAAGKIYLGMTQWGRTEWVGKIYPQRTKQKDFLQHYVKHFNAVELNATHYKLYGSGGIGKWADAARGVDFKFCPKLYKGITHKYPLAGKDFMVNEFLRGVEAFGEHLGPVFIQLHDKFKQKADLHKFLEALPAGYPYFLELRHSDLLTNQELFEYLQSKKIGSVITDTAGRRDGLHMQLTVPQTMIRFVANDHPSDEQRLQEWATRFKTWLDQGIQEIYFFIHHEEETRSIDIAKQAVNTINAVCGDIIPKLELLS
jgi:uncharacterized protein YecE (DUF72 family)